MILIVFVINVKLIFDINICVMNMNFVKFVVFWRYGWFIWINVNCYDWVMLRI